MAAEQVSLSAMVTSRKLDIGDVQARYLVESIRHWPDGPVTVTVKRQRPQKTTLQLGYYFGVIVAMIAEETGNTADAVHRELKRMHLEPQTYEWVNKETGEVEPRMDLPSVSDLNTVQMADYSEKCRVWAGDFLQLEIPEPDPRWKEKARKTA